MCRWDDGFKNSALLGRAVDTKDFADRVENLTRREWFEKQNAEWRNGGVEFGEVLTQHGKCFNVNLQADVYDHDV